MNNLPYSIHTRSRPQRIAFLIDPKNKTMEMIDKIVEYNQGKWGGRFNPIILTDGKTIDENQWEFLRAYDPDVIRLTTSVKDELLEKIEYFLSPYLVEPWSAIDNTHLRVGIHEEGLSILPSQKDISRITGNMAENPRLAVFYVDRNTDKNVERFIVHNFGRYTHYLYLDKVLKNITNKVFEISSYESLDKALKELANSTSMNPFVFPIQLCCSAYSSKRTKYAGEEEEFTVIIGDSPSNATYCWNRGFYIGNAHFPRIKQVWIPKELARNPTITSGMKKFLQEMVWRTDSGAQKILFVSYDINQSELKEIAEKLKPQYFISKCYVFSGIRVPKFDQDYRLHNFNDHTDLHRATGKEAQFVVNEPKVIEGPKHGENWMVDLYIQHISDTYRNYQSNVGFWWKLPNRNRLAQTMFNPISRIGSNGIPSVLVNKQEPIIKITFLEDISIFRNLILSKNTPSLTIDARKKSNKRPFDDLRRSDKGRYLSGILDLFSGLVRASHIFGERYWREMFKKLSRQESSKEKTALYEIDNKLRKIMDKTNGFDQLPYYVLNIANRYGIRGKELKYRDFLEKAISELKGFLLRKDIMQLLNFRFTLEPTLEKELSSDKISDALINEFKKNSIILSSNVEKSMSEQNSQWMILDADNSVIFVILKDDNLKVYEYKYNEADLKKKMSELTESNVLLTGIRPKCPFCGSANWYHIDEAKQNLRCKGCSYEYSMTAHQEWYYKLNTLVQAGCFEHGLIPVILVLGELLLYPGVSFFYAPALEIFEKHRGESYGDLDIVCINNGKFIIGEIKQSVRLFKADDFEKIGEIAERIHPDEVLFSSMDKEPNRLVKEGIEELKKRLAPLEINVSWHRLHSTHFEHSRVMFRKD